MRTLSPGARYRGGIERDPDPGRGAGRQNVSGFQSLYLAQVGDLVMDVEDQVARVTVLA